jgi:lipoprotein-anchoring transpeptidase ErfK/SrfK
LYDRARQAVYNRMRAMDPAVSEDDIRAELATLNNAIARIESDIAGPVEAVLHGARLRHDRADAPPRRARFDDRSQYVEPPVAAVEAGRTPRQALSKRALAGATVIGAAVVIAALGYAVWPRSGTSPRPSASSAPGRAPAPVAAAPAASPTEASRQAAETAESAIPYILRRQLVYYRTTYPTGTIIIIKPQHFLYLVADNAAATRYTIAIGADCQDAAGMLTVARKEGGPEGGAQVVNAADQPPPPPPPSGNAAVPPTLFLGDTSCRIRATNTAAAIGRDASSNGFQLITDDMLDLYDRIPVGTKVVVMN